MTHLSNLARAAVVATAVLTVAAPAFAKTRPVIISSATFATPESRLCMPARPLGIKVDKGQPQLMCLVRSEWEAKGVTFTVR